MELAAAIDAVIVGVIHHRREKVGGHHDGTLLIQLPDGSIIRGIQTDQQVRIVLLLE